MPMGPTLLPSKSDTIPSLVKMHFLKIIFSLSACVGISTAPLKALKCSVHVKLTFFSVKLALVLRQKLLKREFQKLRKSSGPLWLAVMSKIKYSF